MVEQSQKNVGTIKHFNIHDLIRVKTNSHIHPPSFFLRKFEEDADIEVYRENEISTPLSDLEPLGLRLFFNDSTFVHKCRIFLDTHLEIKETKNKIVIRFNRMYQFFRNPAAYYFAFLQMKLLEKGFTFIHAAGISKNGTGYIFPAFSDTGKTLTTLSFLHDGYKLLGDDHLITDGKHVLCYPNPLRRLQFKRLQLFPILRKLVRKKLISFPETQIAKKSIPKSLYFLKLGKRREVAEVDKSDIVEKIHIMTETTSPLFPYPKGVMLGYYFVRNIKFDTFLEKKKRIIDKLVRNTKTFIVNAPKSPEFYELIKKNEAM